MLTLRSVNALGYPAKAKVREFLQDLEDKYLVLHPKAGPAWLEWYRDTAKNVLDQVSREPMGAQKIIYQTIFRKVIAPTGQKLDLNEVEQAMKNLHATCADLCQHYGLDCTLPPPPPVEPIGLLRAQKPNRVAAPSGVGGP